MTVNVLSMTVNKTRHSLFYCSSIQFYLLRLICAHFRICLGINTSVSYRAAPYFSIVLKNFFNNRDKLNLQDLYPRTDHISVKCKMIQPAH